MHLEKGVRTFNSDFMTAFDYSSSANGKELFAYANVHDSKLMLALLEIGDRTTGENLFIQPPNAEDEDGDEEEEEEEEEEEVGERSTRKAREESIIMKHKWNVNIDSKHQCFPYILKINKERGMIMMLETTSVVKIFDIETQKLKDKIEVESKSDTRDHHHLITDDCWFLLLTFFSLSLVLLKNEKKKKTKGRCRNKHSMSGFDFDCNSMIMAADGRILRGFDLRESCKSCLTVTDMLVEAQYENE